MSPNFFPGKGRLHKNPYLQGVSPKKISWGVSFLPGWGAREGDKNGIRIQKFGEKTRIFWAIMACFSHCGTLIWMKIPGWWRSICWFWREIFHLPTKKCTPKTSTEIWKRRQSRFYARSFLIPWNSYSSAVVTTHDSGSSEFGYTWPRYHLGVKSQVLHGMVTPEE